MRKRDHFRRAKAHLESGEDVRLPYAALELRFCLEEIVYAKLKAYERRLPEKVKRKWQPPQALKALLSLEPDADKDFILRMARQEGDGVPGTNWRQVGEHRFVKLDWLKKNYNRLGSYLHSPTPFESPEYPYRVQLQKMREALQEMVDYLGPVVASRTEATLARIVTFDCAVCGVQVVCNEAGLEKTGMAVCLDPDCATEYLASRDEGGEWVFDIPAVAASCGNCNAAIPIQERLLKPGLEVRCASCERSYRVGLTLFDTSEEAAQNDEAATASDEATT